MTTKTKEELNEELNILKAKITKASLELNSPNIIQLTNGEEGHIDPDKVLASAFTKLEKVVLAGVDKEGRYYFASSIGDGGEILWLVEKLKFILMQE